MNQPEETSAEKLPAVSGKIYTFHKDMVTALKKSGVLILSSLTPTKCDAIHMTMGVSGEAGELLDAVKKWTMYEKDMDRENVLEELGDLEFFLEGLRQTLGISRAETLAKNIEKLGKRYHKGTFTNEQAQERADKQ